MSPDGLTQPDSIVPDQRPQITSNLAPTALNRPLRWGCWDAGCNLDLN
jgi:hypothetical protein